jgi:hypothetical protein
VSTLHVCGSKCLLVTAMSDMDSLLSYTGHRLINNIECTHCLLACTSDGYTWPHILR